jgi:hypothetical protein
MKFLGLLSVGLFCAGSILFFRSLRSEQVERSVRAEDLDLGPVEQGRTVPFAFRVANATSRPVTVVEVAKSCGCTFLQDRRGARIEPGGSLSIEGTLDTTGRRGPIEIASTLAYRRAEGRPQQLLLLVRADVRPTLRVAPESLTFKLDHAAGDRLAKDVSIDSLRLDSFRLLGCETSAPWLTAGSPSRPFVGPGAKRPRPTSKSRSTRRRLLPKTRRGSSRTKPFESGRPPRPSRSSSFPSESRSPEIGGVP